MGIQDFQCIGCLQKSPPCHIISVNESNEALGEGEGVADEGGELSVMRLARQDVQVLTQLASPSLAHRHKILGEQLVLNYSQK